MNRSEEIAERIKETIRENGGYDRLSELTNISKSTLVRMASGKTEPKLRDVIEIAEITNTSLTYLVYGTKGESVEEQTAHIIAQALSNLSKQRHH